MCAYREIRSRPDLFFIGGVREKIRELARLCFLRMKKPLTTSGFFTVFYFPLLHPTITSIIEQPYDC